MIQTRIALFFCIISLVLGVLLGILFHKTLTNRKLRKLAVLLEPVMRGDYSPKFTQFKEGAYGMLTSQIELAVLRTQNAVETVNKEKAEIEQFIFDFSHQIKTPLAGIISYLDLWQEEEIPSRMRSQTELALLLASRIEQLVKTLLELSRLESGHMILNFTELSPLELISSAKLAALASFPAETRKISLTANANESLRGDEKWLSQALVNLISNALVYSNGEGSVDISVISSENTVIFRVSNPGEISREVADNMFRRFYRRSTDSNGFGLGLSIAKSIARLHKGDIRAESSKGRTTLILTVSKNACSDSI